MVRAVTQRSTPAYAIGGVAYLTHENELSCVGDPVPSGWRCFHCNEHFTHWIAARRHFGNPGKRAMPVCVTV